MLIISLFKKRWWKYLGNFYFYLHWSIKLSRKLLDLEKSCLVWDYDGIIEATILCLFVSFTYDETFRFGMNVLWCLSWWKLLKSTIFLEENDWTIALLLFMRNNPSWFFCEWIIHFLYMPSNARYHLFFDCVEILT